MRFGLLGCGAIGALRAQALRATPGAELHAVVDPVAERARALATASGAIVAASLEELLDSPQIDAVVVSTPPHLHRRQVEMALRAGKHVLCEKPLAPTAEACRIMVAVAEQHGQTLATGFNYRFYPAVAKARELIAAGRLGDVDHVASATGHPGGPEFTHPWVQDPKIVGGGALMDNGIHLADLTLHFLGPISEAHGFATERVWHFPGSEDNGYVLMRTPEGRIGTLHASWSQWRGYHFQVEIVGTRGSVRLQYPPMATIFYERPDGSAKRGRRQVFFFPGFQIRERLHSYRWTVVRSFVAEHVDFMNRVAGRGGIGATGLDGLRAVEVASAAYGARGASEDLLARAGA